MKSEEERESEKRLEQALKSLLKTLFLQVGDLVLGLSTLIYAYFKGYGITGVMLTTFFLEVGRCAVTALTLKDDISLYDEEGLKEKVKERLPELKTYYMALSLTAMILMKSGMFDMTGTFLGNFLK